MFDPLTQKELVNVGGKMSAAVRVYCDRSAKVGEKVGETIDDCGFVVFESCPSVGEAGEVIDEMENVPETAGGNGERADEIHTQQVERLEGKNGMKRFKAEGIPELSAFETRSDILKDVRSSSWPPSNLCNILERFS